METQEEATKFFEDVLNYFKIHQMIPIQQATEEISKKYDYSIYDIPVAYDWHIKQSNLLLTVRHGQVCLYRSFDSEPQDWKWKIKWKLIPVEPEV